jgi:hypothetical protein
MNASVSEAGFDLIFADCGPLDGASAAEEDFSIPTKPMDFLTTSSPSTHVAYAWVAVLCVTLSKPDDTAIVIDMKLNWYIGGKS